MSQSIPAITKKQMIEIDRIMIVELGISLLQMMENAGRNFALFARDYFLQGSVARKTIIVLAGSGGNGGGVLAAARHLSNWGAHVTVYLGKPLANYSDAPLNQLQTLKKMKVNIQSKKPEDTLPKADILLDGLIGYSLNGAPQGRIAKLIEWTNHRLEPIISLDVPSGLDVDTGEAQQPTVNATATLTLALPKQGLINSKALDYVGDLYLTDISVPHYVYEKTGIDIEDPFIFKKSTIIEL